MSLAPADVADGHVAELDGFAVGMSKGEPFAVSRRCRHQLSDLSRGTVDGDGCLVCPWHQARYDVRSGRMVDGPRGVFGYHGRVPGVSGAVKLLTYAVPLRVRRVISAAGALRLG